MEEIPNIPSPTNPRKDWTHYQIWERVSSLLYALPNYFETELIVKGINVTEIFSVGGAFSSIVEAQVVSILNNLRNLWDPDNRYSKYAFVRQSQTFPDVLFQNLRDESEVLFGIELKSWYVLSKEGEPSFRYQVTPAACADADLIAVIPWILSDVISGTPRLLRPYTELARYAAEYRNYYWKKSRIEQEKICVIRHPAASNCHPYPSSKQEASDQAEDDKGGNFGRIARAGILDEYVSSIKEQDYLGIKIMHWIAFFKAISETTTDEEITRKLQALKRKIQGEQTISPLQENFLEIIHRIEELWEKFS